MDGEDTKGYLACEVFADREGWREEEEEEEKWC